MPLTDSLDDVASAIKSIVEANAAALSLQDVFYGDEELIPRTPAVSVDPDEKVRELRATGHTVINNFRVYVTVYHSKLGSAGFNRQEAVQLAEQVEALINADKVLSLGVAGEDRVVNGYCIAVQEGFSQRSKTVMRASRITWEGFSRTRI